MCSSDLLGRSSVCHFQIEDPLVSALHCYISYEQSNFIVYDLLSANGLLVNKQLVDTATLHKGDILKIGKTQLEVSEYKGTDPSKTYITGEVPNLGGGIVEEEKEEKREGEGSKRTLGRMIKSPRDLNICRLALKNKLITHEKIRDLLEMRKKKAEEGKKPDLSALLVSENLLSEENIQKLLNEHNYYKVRNKDICFSRVVKQQKIVDDEKIHECLALQEKYFKETGQVPRLGEILVRKNYLTVQQNNRIIKALAKQREQKI